jgi:hypothetical protein
MVHKLIGVFKQFGFFVGLAYGADRVLQRVSSRLRLYMYRLMVQPISEKPLVPARFTRRLHIREIGRGDPEVLQMPARKEIKELRFQQNAICLGAFQDGHLIAYMWFCFRAYDEDEVRCTYIVTPEKESVFDFDFFIFPEHRLGLAFAGLWNGANQFLRERNVKYTFSRLTQFNVASRRAHDHLGWKCVGRVMFFQAWRLEIMIGTIFPYWHLSLSETKRVHLKLRPDALLRHS